MAATAPVAPAAPAAPDNWVLIRRLFGLAWRYWPHCLRVLGIQLVLLTLGVGGLSFTGLGIDYIRHRIDHTPLGPNPLHITLPEDRPALQVLGGLAGCILLFAVIRAVLNYVYAVSVNRLV